MSAMLLYIITSAILFSFLLTSENIPQQMAQWIIGQGLSPWMFLLFVNVLLFFAGDFMGPSSILLILAPIFSWRRSSCRWRRSWELIRCIWVSS